MRNHNKREIEIIANSFREALEKACDDGRFTKRPFNNFPSDCCDDSCILLGRYYLERGYECNLIRGKYTESHFEEGKLYPVERFHVWLEVDGYYVDITADQFLHDTIFSDYQMYLVPCFVGSSNKFFDSFCIVNNEVYFEIYVPFFENDISLENYYNIICSYI